MLLANCITNSIFTSQRFFIVFLKLRRQFVGMCNTNEKLLKKKNQISHKVACILLRRDLCLPFGTDIFDVILLISSGLISIHQVSQCVFVVKILPNSIYSDTHAHAICFLYNIAFFLVMMHSFCLSLSMMWMIECGFYCFQMLLSGCYCILVDECYLIACVFLFFCV